MTKKITRSEYLARRLVHVRKKRLRKKLTNGIQDLFISYCIRGYGMSGLFYALYSDGDHLKNLVNTKNPFLSMPGN